MVFVSVHEPAVKHVEYLAHPGYADYLTDGFDYANALLHKAYAAHPHYDYHYY